MTRSETIADLAAALALAQQAMTHAKKDSENPHFRRKYADLAAVIDACRPALAAHGLSFTQAPRLVSAGEAMWLVEVETTIWHASGQFIADTLAVPVSPATAQAVGSAITYCKRYSLASLVGVAPAGDDDDGETTEPLPTRTAKRPVPPVRTPAKLPADPGTLSAKVLGVVQRPLADGAVRYIVTCDDQRTYHSLKLEHATIAKDAQTAGRPVALVWLQHDDGRVIVDIKESEAP